MSSKHHAVRHLAGRRPGSPDYTLAGGSSARGHQQAFLMNYNEPTGAFGQPRYYSDGNRPALATHFDGITAVPGGFNLVAISSAQAASMAFVPVSARDGSFGPATWYPVNVSASPLCPDGCGAGDREHRLPESGDGALRPHRVHGDQHLPGRGPGPVTAATT